MNTEQFRVTSVRFRNSSLVIFMGVPLQKGSYKLNSGKYTVSVKAHPEMLPASPAVGQHWQVKGTRSFSKYENNGYQMKQHVFDSPVETKCTLPQSGEQVINFIANERTSKALAKAKQEASGMSLEGIFIKLLVKIPLNQECASKRF